MVSFFAEEKAPSLAEKISRPGGGGRNPLGTRHTHPLATPFFRATPPQYNIVAPAPGGVRLLRALGASADPAHRPRDAVDVVRPRGREATGRRIPPRPAAPATAAAAGEEGGAGTAAGEGGIPRHSTRRLRGRRPRGGGGAGGGGGRVRPTQIRVRRAAEMRTRQAHSPCAVRERDATYSATNRAMEKVKRPSFLHKAGASHGPMRW